MIISPKSGEKGDSAVKPMRVRAGSSITGTEYILASRVCKDKDTGDYWVYVFDRHIPNAPSGQGTLPIEEVKEITTKELAHRMINKWNSTILEAYTLEREENGRRYILSRQIFGSHEHPITKYTGIEPTQEDCVRLAMNDYCSRNNLTILEEL
jgi:hypothetical protein